uniref:Uncharacterized protein n=1 Tax=Rhizophora mucronata TaxID=61149 RepID=A0A2P2L2F2_RHIMU
MICQIFLYFTDFLFIDCLLLSKWNYLVYAVMFSLDGLSLLILIFNRLEVTSPCCLSFQRNNLVIAHWGLIMQSMCGCLLGYLSCMRSYSNNNRLGVEYC